MHEIVLFTFYTFSNFHEASHFYYTLTKMFKQSAAAGNFSACYSCQTVIECLIMHCTETATAALFVWDTTAVTGNLN